MPTRKVLTVNQVFDIMIKYNECQDWRVAFETVIPKRKFKAESKAMSNRGHKRAWEERDSSTASPSQGEHKHMRADSEAGDSDEQGDEETAVAVMDVDDEEAALNAQ
jgi:tRNA (guanine9-N1)-methyltransferase